MLNYFFQHQLFPQHKPASGPQQGTLASTACTGQQTTSTLLNQVVRTHVWQRSHPDQARQANGLLCLGS
jgi:hypothetical protein